MFDAYLEDFKEIKIIINRRYDLNDFRIFLRDVESQSQLSVIRKEYVYNDIHLYCRSVEDVNPYLDYCIDIESIGLSNLKLGRITRSNDFDDKFYFKGWLGFKYTKKYTTFRVWSPVVKELKIVLNDIEYPLTYTENGVWEVKVEGDLDSYRYYYLYRINEKFHKTLDPYAISSSSNNEFNYVIDSKKTYQNKYSFYKHDEFKFTDAIIYELNVRDATSKVKCDDFGTYDALSNSVVTDYGLGYIKNLGITHLQLMPIFAFGGVDENIHNCCDSKFRYNWGYNPMQYNVPSGFFSKFPDDPYERINELKRLIDAIHSLNIGVNMDVVFNHVYDNNWFPMEKLVPGYTFRTDDRGYLTNSSWCGNDLRTEHLMVRKLIVDSINYYQTFYKIDGFRFDLMGLIDIDTINIIKKNIKKINPIAMIYGEGWNMDVKLSHDKRANMNNCDKLLGVGFFNDCFRNNLRGNSSELGYSMGKKISRKHLLQLLRGYNHYNGQFVDASQSVNYVECHDNYTFYDLCKLNLPRLDDKKIADFARLSLGLVMFSQGIPFIHAGEELLRTKELIDNTYNESDDINGINWYKENAITDTLKDLIKIRKEYPVFRSVDKLKINKQVLLEEYGKISKFRLIDDQYNELQLIVSNNYEEIDEYFAPGTTLIFDGQRIQNKDVQMYTINKPGVYLFKK